MAKETTSTSTTFEYMTPGVVVIYNLLWWVSFEHSIDLCR